MSMGPLNYLNLVASGSVKASGGVLHTAILTGGSDAATLIVYDNTAGSGTIILKLAAAAGVTVVAPLNCGWAFGKGCYAALTGTAPSASFGYV